MAEIGALASVIGIAGAGAKISIAIFDFVSIVGAAASEMAALGTEVSQFCVVLKQVEATLSKAKKSVRYSMTALLGIESITKQCDPILKEIEQILSGLKKKNAEPNFMARLAWTLKRSKVQLLRKTLESAKLTLSCMLMTLLFAENIASRDIPTVETQKEDERQQAVTQSLLLARRCCVDELERLEDEDAETNGDFDGVDAASINDRSSSPDFLSSPVTKRRANRRSVIMNEVLLSPNVDSQDSTKHRNSLLFNNIISSDRPSAIQQWPVDDGSSLTDTQSQPIHLLQRWTQEGHRLSRLIDPTIYDRDSPMDQVNASFQRSAIDDSPPGGPVQSPAGSLGRKARRAAHHPTLHSTPTPWSEPSPPSTSSPRSPTGRVNEPSQSNPGPTSPLWRRDEPSPSQESKQEQPEVPPLNSPGVEILKKFRVSMDDPTYKVLPAALKKHNITADWRDYDLYLVVDDQERCLDLEETPLRLFRQQAEEGKKPSFVLRRNQRIATRSQNSPGRRLPGPKEVRLTDFGLSDNDPWPAENPLPFILETRNYELESTSFVLRKLIEKYGLCGNPDRYSLTITSRGKEHYFKMTERPVQRFNALNENGEEPVLLLRPRASTPTIGEKPGMNRFKVSSPGDPSSSGEKSPRLPVG